MRCRHCITRHPDHGYYYLCCQPCFKKTAAAGVATKKNSRGHEVEDPHDLGAVGAAAPRGGGNGILTEEQQQRQRRIAQHLRLLVHAVRCTSPTCPSNHCRDMKGQLDHARTCRVKGRSGCHICRRVGNLLRRHAAKCQHRQCPVPKCRAIRANVRTRAAVTAAAACAPFSETPRIPALRYIEHTLACSVRRRGGCPMCWRIHTRLKAHAQTCHEIECPIPHCLTVRESRRSARAAAAAAGAGNGPT